MVMVTSGGQGDKVKYHILEIWWGKDWWILLHVPGGRQTYNSPLSGLS
jgi:hypothetical protein